VSEGAASVHDVTILVPVRNGGSTLRRVLDGLVAQTLAGARIIVSNNASTDDTLAIALEYAEKHPMVTVVTQREMSAHDHFRTMYDLVETPYFMWAAHDDFHSPEFLERLLPALHDDPSLSATFPNLVLFTDGEEVLAKEAAHFPCDTRGLSFRRRIALVAEHHLSMALYGLWRREAFATYAWPITDIAEDWVMTWYVVAAGDIGWVDGARFYYYLPPTPKSLRERAKNDVFRDLRRFAWLRVYWTAAKVASDAWRGRGRPKGLLTAFVEIAYVHRRLVLKQWVAARVRRPVGTT
jgi:glycosyltransferase involved in cell wall biosynthesis